MLVERFGVSERHACRVVGQHRSTQRLEPQPRPEEEEKVAGKTPAAQGAAPAAKKAAPGEAPVVDGGAE